MKKKLEEYSVEELEAAIEKKKLTKKIEFVPFDVNRYEKFLKEINEITQDIINGDDKDSEHWIYEATLKYAYGENVFDILNELTK